MQPRNSEWAYTIESLFPVASDQSEFERAEVQKSIKKLSAEAIAMIHAVKPYQGGEDLLWSLHKLDKTDKHRMLCPIASTIVSPEFRLKIKNQGTGGMRFQPLYGGWRPVGNEVELLHYPSDADFVYDFTINFSVSFSDAGPVAGMPVIHALKKIGDLVEQILARFEKRFFS
jgi:hypothetical protein